MESRLGLGLIDGEVIDLIERLRASWFYYNFNLFIFISIIWSKLNESDLAA